MEWVYAISALASAIAAVLAWAAKLWWGKEYSAAKDETIKSKNAEIEVLKREIETLRQLTPMKIREYFLSVKEQLEEYNNTLQSDLEKAKAEIQEKTDKIQFLEATGTNQAVMITTLEKERAELEAATAGLEKFRHLLSDKNKFLIFAECKTTSRKSLEVNQMKHYYNTLNHYIHKDYDNQKSDYMWKAIDFYLGTNQDIGELCQKWSNVEDKASKKPESDNNEGGENS